MAHGRGDRSVRTGLKGCGPAGGLPVLQGGEVAGSDPKAAQLCSCRTKGTSLSTESSSRGQGGKAWGAGSQEPGGRM